MKKTKYTKKQISEAIKYWTKQLKKMNESYDDSDSVTTFDVSAVLNVAGIILDIIQTDDADAYDRFDPDETQIQEIQFHDVDDPHGKFLVDAAYCSASGEYLPNAWKINGPTTDLKQLVVSAINDVIPDEYGTYLLHDDPSSINKIVSDLRSGKTSELNIGGEFHTYQIINL